MIAKDEVAMGEGDTVASGDSITILSVFPEALVGRVFEAVPGVRVIGIPGDGELDEDIRGDAQPQSAAQQERNGYKLAKPRSTQLPESGLLMLISTQNYLGATAGMEQDEQRAHCSL